MNKKLLTMAVGAALAMGSMAANADSTFYGQLQMEFANVSYDEDKVDDAVTPDVDDNKSDDGSGFASDDNKRGRLGIKASEDLGGGLTGLAKFEWQVDTSDADPIDGKREAMVGLKGGFGEIQLGQIKGAYKYTGGVKYDTFVATFLEARGGNGGMLGNGIGTAGLPYKVGTTSNVNNLKPWLQHAFIQDALGYKGKWGMFSLWVNYGLEGLKSETSTGRNFGDLAIGAKIGNKQWEAFTALVSKDVNVNLAANLQNRGTFTAQKFGGKFKMGGGGMSHTIKLQLEAFALEEDEEIDTGTGSATFGDATATVLDDEVVGVAQFVGYDLGMGKTTITVQVGGTVMEGDDNDVAITNNDYEQTASYTAVGVTHKFSKKTRVFAGFRTTVTEKDFDDVATYDTEVETSVLSFGLRKDF